MKISLPNSKKCLTAKLAVFLLSTSAFATTSPTPSSLIQDINANRSSSFERVLNQWGRDHGVSAVDPLLAIATNRKNSDKQRYVALMGAAKLGGSAGAEKIVPFLKDRTWMIRSGALKALSALKNPKTAQAVLPLLHDPALVVRAQAVDATRELRPQGASKALIAALHSQENYRFGKAQWVPIQALSALQALNDPSIALELRPLLDHKSDPALQKQAMATLESLTGIKINHQLPHAAQVESCKASLARLPRTAKN